ncbi:hypothetical protein CCMA1212_007083 [Trichoderma ghanense]|uniref:Rhodopsin domain-containing protein n=1 Tax=Trichoderma ghanense TaxID=65468 RepID=A0ABY2H0J8_9HYPO
MEDLRTLSYFIISLLYLLAMATIGMRIWVRGFSMNSFGWDDWAMSSLLVFFTGQQAILYFFLQYGAGMHITQFMTEHPEWMALLLKGLLLEEFWYVFMQFAVKMCFLLFFFRLSSTPLFLQLLWAIVGFHVASTLAIWLLYALQCRPLKAFYAPELYPDAQCLSTNITYFVPYSLNLFVDVCILALPLPTIWALQMPFKRRMAVLVVLTTGGSAVLISGLRAIILIEFSRSPDFTYSLGKMIIISSAEMSIGIIAANMPALKAFWSCWREDKLGAGKATDLTGSQNAAPIISKLSNDGAIELNSNFTASRNAAKGDVGYSERLPSTESEEQLCET